MPETTRPLVTFAVIAYKQERFIREAIEGAFAQTYQPLEIILSDDCSPDRTYQIMQEAYGDLHLAPKALSLLVPYLAEGKVQRVYEAIRTTS